MARYVLDRLEGDWAIVEAEDGSMTRIARTLLSEAHEGDALEEANGQWQVDPVRTEALREAVRQRLKRLARNK